jgi:hypothetical protein
MGEISPDPNPGSPIKRDRWALGGALAAFTLAAWFVWSVVIEWRWRLSLRHGGWIPINIWPLMQGLIFAAIGVGVLRERPRARPWLLGGGLVTVLLSALAAATNQWSAMAIVPALGMIVCALRWKPEG